MRGARDTLPALALALALALAGAPGAAAANERYAAAIRALSEGRPAEADRVLNELIRDEPMHAGAWLDLALIECELGHAAEAERLFEAILARFAPPPAIREVIALRRAGGCLGWQPRNHAALLLGRGVDNNVNQGASNPLFSVGSGDNLVERTLSADYLPQRDQYTQLSADLGRTLGPDGASVFGQARVRRNAHLSALDTASLFAGGDYPWSMGAWSARASASAGVVTLGRQLYQRQVQLQLRAAPPLPLPPELSLSMVAGASHVQYPTRSHYDANMSELGGLLAYQGERAQGQAGIGYTADRGDAQRLGGARAGWAASVQYQARLGEAASFELGWTRQLWRSGSAYAPGLIDLARRQDTRALRAALLLPLRPDTTLQVEWRHIRNDENISLFQYNDRQLQISLRWKQ